MSSPLRLSEESQGAGVLPVAETVSESEKEKLKQQKAAEFMEGQIYTTLQRPPNDGRFGQRPEGFYQQLGIHEEKARGEIHIQASEDFKTTSTAIHLAVLNIMKNTKTLNPVIAAEGGTLDTAGVTKQEALEALRGYEARLTTQAGEKTATAETEHKQPEQEKAAKAAMEDDDDDLDAGPAQRLG